MIDLHCHVLPDLDDGAGSTEARDAMFQAAAATGVRILAATSHYSRDAEAKYDRVFAEAREAASRCGIELVPGMEYDYDRLTEIEPEKLRGLGGASTVLIDLKESYVWAGVGELLFSLGLKGKEIMLAHPERLWGRACMKNLEMLPAGNWTLQINSGSVLGVYGAEARRGAWTLLESFPRCIIAGDAHRASGFRGEKCREALLAAFPEENVRLWMEENPARILAGKRVLASERDHSTRRKIRRFWNRVR